MEEKDKGKIFIVIGLIGIIVLIPLLKAKPPEIEAEIISTEYREI